MRRLGPRGAAATPSEWRLNLRSSKIACSDRSRAWLLIVDSRLVPVAVDCSAMRTGRRALRLAGARSQTLVRFVAEALGRVQLARALCCAARTWTSSCGKVGEFSRR